MNDLDHYAFIFGCAYAEACGKDPGDDVALLGQADRAGLAAVIEEVRKERPTEANDEAFNDGIEAAATYIAGLDNPWREGGDTLGMADDIRALKRQSAGEGEE